MSDDLEFQLWRQAAGGATEAERSRAAERLAARPAARRSRALEADLAKVRAIVEDRLQEPGAAARPRQVGRPARSPGGAVSTSRG